MRPVQLCATPSARAIVRAAALGCALSFGLALGCLAELPRGPSCGDGWWDPDHEGCDPSSADRSYVEACRAQGWVIDASCSDACELRASEQDCELCGDGIASGSEECDGNDVRDASCPSGSGVVRCTDACTLDYELCPELCGDGIVNGTEECERALSCGDDQDCGDDRVCYPLFGECVSGDAFGPNLGCAFYNTTAIGVAKPYASGTISRCTDDCFFGRNKCGFCGDGELDGEYTDLVFPGGDAAEFPAEVCDGDEALRDELQAYCEPLCVDDAINADVVVLCDFECNANCSGFAPPDDVVVPGENPEALGCCLAKGSPCPKFGTEGVPELPCCSWLERPEWLAEQKCVAKLTDQLPVPLVCP